MPSLIACRLPTSIALSVNISWWTDRGPYHIADRDCEALAKVSYKEAARFKRKPTAWHPPWPPRPEPRVGTEDEADDLLLRAAQAALRRGGVPAIALSSKSAALVALGSFPPGSDGVIARRKPCKTLSEPRIN